jgi:mono/diheme cytochrome c family protein
MRSSRAWRVVASFFSRAPSALAVRALAGGLAAMAVGSIGCFEVHIPVPSVDSSQVDAILEQAGDDDNGARLYTENCTRCHGEDARSGGAARDLPAAINSDPAAAVETINSGRGEMPEFDSTLTNQEIADLILYLRSLGSGGAHARAPLRGTHRGQPDEGARRVRARPVARRRRRKFDQARRGIVIVPRRSPAPRGRESARPSGPPKRQARARRRCREMRERHLRAIAFGFFSACAASAALVGCASDSSSDDAATTADDTAASVSAVESAKESADEIQASAQECFDTFKTCTEAEGADPAACKSELEACLPDGPESCEGDGEGGGHGGPPGGGDGPGGDGDHGPPGTGGAPPAPPPPPPPDGAGAAGSPPTPPPGFPPPCPAPTGDEPTGSAGAGGEGGAAPCGPPHGHGHGHGHGPKGKHCGPKGFGGNEAIAACRAELTTCVSSSSDAATCGDAFAICLKGALDDALAKFCESALQSCDAECDAVAAACESLTPASP